MLRFAIYTVYNDHLDLVNCIGNWPEKTVRQEVNSGLTLDPGKWHLMAQGIETGSLTVMRLGGEVIQFDPQSEIPLMIPVQFITVTLSEVTEINLVVQSVNPFTLFLTELWVN